MPKDDRRQRYKAERDQAVAALTSVQNENDLLREELKDFVDFGCRCDPNPTVMGQPSVSWWYGYIQSMDKRTRERAKLALEKADEYRANQKSLEEEKEKGGHKNKRPVK